MLIAAAATAAGGLLAAATIRNPPRKPARKPDEPSPDDHSLNARYCALDAPPLRTTPARAAIAAPKPADP